MAAPAVRLHGMRQFLAAVSKADRDTRLGVRSAMVAVAQPVADDAERLAVERIRRVGPDWSRMRVGVTRRVVYVAPRQRGRKTRDTRSEARRRADQQFGTRLMDEAMEPALEQNRPGFEVAVGRALDVMADRFNQGGPVL